MQRGEAEIFILQYYDKLISVIKTTIFINALKSNVTWKQYFI